MRPPRPQPNPGQVALHRLNRTEYANAIADLLALEVDVEALLPKDDESDGFDNVANVLKVSPSFLEQYIAAARVISEMAVGNPEREARQPRLLRRSPASTRTTTSQACRSARAAACSSSISSRPTATTSSTSAASRGRATSKGSSTGTG